MDKIAIIYKDINSLIDYDNNARNNDDAVQKVAESIKQFGFKVPIVIDKDSVIIAGHTRKKACEVLGIKQVPCIIADDLTDEQVKAFRLADNKVAEFSHWDFSKLNDELESISIDMSVLGFTRKFEELDIDSMIDSVPKTQKEKKYMTCPHCGEKIEI